MKYSTRKRMRLLGSVLVIVSVISMALIGIFFESLPSWSLTIYFKIAIVSIGALGMALQYTPKNTLKKYSS